MLKPENCLWRRAIQAVRPAFLVVGFFSLFVNLMMLIAPVYMMQVYDRVLTSQSADTLLMLTLLAVGLLLLSGAVDAARSRLLVRISSDLDSKLSPELFAGAFRITGDGGQNSASQPLSDFDKVRMFLTGPGILALFDGPWVPIYLTIIFLLHPLLGLVALGGAILIFLIALTSELSTRHSLQKAGNFSRSSRNYVDSFFRNSEAIRAMGMLPQLQQRWRSQHDRGIGWQALASDRMGTLQASAKTLRMGLQIAILGFGAWLALAQEISPGAMIAASIIMGRALAPVEASIAQWRNFVEARGALSRLKLHLSEMDANENNKATQLPAPKGHLTLENVGLKLAGVEKPVLRAVSFELRPGEMLGVVGPSGAGKSSLAKLIVGAKAASVGEVRIDGAAIDAYSREALGPYIGYLPQDSELLVGTVAENIARFGPHDSKKIVAAAKLANAHDMILALPHGYETMLGEGGRNLSGGQRQRIGLARAVYGDARVIVLDEPNSNLDSEGEAALKTTLTGLKNLGRTVVAIVHKPSLLAEADRVLLLRDGLIESFGKRNDVIAKLKVASSHQHRGNDLDVGRMQPGQRATTSPARQGGRRS